MAKNKFHQKQPGQPNVNEENTTQASEKKVKMIFSEPKYYNDQSHPIFEKNKVYELEGAGWIERWQKRGGKIVEDNTNLEHADQEDGPSTHDQAQEQDNKRKMDQHQEQIKKNEPDATQNLKSPADERKEQNQPKNLVGGDNAEKTDQTTSHDQVPAPNKDSQDL